MTTNREYTLTVEKTNFEGIASFEKLLLELSDGTQEELDVNTLFYENGLLFCKVKEGEVLANFTQYSSLFIVDRLMKHDGAYYVKLCGKTIFLKEADTVKD